MFYFLSYYMEQGLENFLDITNWLPTKVLDKFIGLHYTGSCFTHYKFIAEILYLICCKAKIHFTGLYAKLRDIPPNVRQSQETLYRLDKKSGDSVGTWYKTKRHYHIYPTPPLGQDMTQGRFLSGV